MSDIRIGLIAMIGACTIWGLSPIYYKELAHIPTPKVMAHRVLWSLIFFVGLLAFQGRIKELSAAFSQKKRFAILVFAAAMVSTNWFLFSLLRKSIATPKPVSATTSIPWSPF